MPVIQTNENEQGKLGPPKGHKTSHMPRPDHVDETINLALDKCPECNHKPKCCFGLNLLILIAFLRYGIIMPFNKIAKELDICYGIHISEGTIQNQLTRFANYLGPEFEGIKREVKEMAAVNVDETSQRINGKNHWLWAFITKWHSLLVVRDSRGKNCQRKYSESVMTA